METPPTPQTLRTTYFGNELTVRGKLPNFPCQRPRRFYLQCHGGVLATEEEETKMRGDGGGGRVSFGFPENPGGFLFSSGTFSRFLVFVVPYASPGPVLGQHSKCVLVSRSTRESGEAHPAFFPPEVEEAVGREVGSAEAFVRTTYPPATHHPWLLLPPLPRSAPRCS